MTHISCLSNINQNCFNHSPALSTFPLSDLQTPFPCMCSWRIQDCCRSHPGESHWLVHSQQCWVYSSLLLRSFNRQNNSSLRQSQAQIQDCLFPTVLKYLELICPSTLDTKPLTSFLIVLCRRVLLRKKDLYNVFKDKSSNSALYLCNFWNFVYMKGEAISGLSVQNRGVFHSDCPIRADRERSRFWNDPQCSHKSSLGTCKMDGRRLLTIITWFLSVVLNSRIYLIAVGDDGFKQNSFNWRVFQECYRVVRLVKFWGVIIHILNSDGHNSIGCLQIVVSLGCLQRVREGSNYYR